MSESDDKKVPQGRLSRLASLASVGMRSGASLLLSRAGKSGDAAGRAADVLGQLRGLAAKAGQMAGYVDGVIPAEHRESWETALEVLQAAAPRSSTAEIRALVESELKAPIDLLFAEWDDQPVASASIGQVHRARLPDSLGGGEVAVKVQHPGIARALEADLKNAGMLESLGAALGGRRLNSKEVLAAIRARFREELDYSLEATRMELFRPLCDARIRIAPVIRERSTSRVLSTGFVRGKRFNEACLEPETARAAWAATMWRFLFRGNLVLAHFNADPHPGNYFFHDDGAVTFLDFGCVNPILPRQLGMARAIHRAAIDRDEARFREEVRVRMPTRAGRLEKPSLDYIRRCFEPLFGSPARLTREYAASLVEGMKELGKLALTTPEKELFQMPEDMVFMNRLQFGFYSVLARLDVEVDYAQIERDIWPEVQQAISRTMTDTMH